MTISLSLPVIGQSRPCGECDKCCDVIGVLELGKPYYVRCQHQGEPGCKIHGSHPESCREWACLWAEQEVLPSDVSWRPDNLGVIFAYEMDSGQDDSFVKWLTIYETRPGGIGRIGDGFTDPTFEPREEIVQAIAEVISVDDGTLYGIRMIKFNQRVPTSYYFNTAVYPDEGETIKTRPFAVSGTQPPWVKAILAAPQRGSGEPLVDSRPNSMLAVNDFIPADSPYKDMVGVGARKISIPGVKSAPQVRSPMLEMLFDAIQSLAAEAIISEAMRAMRRPHLELAGKKSHGERKSPKDRADERRRKRKKR